MHTFIRRSLFIIVTGIMGGCGLSMGAKSAALPATQADTKTALMQSGGVNELQLTVPADTKCVAADSSLDLTAPQYEVEFWLVRGAQSVDEALGRVGPRIVDQFKDFKADSTTDLTVDGSPAKQMIGTGHEADDGDPGDADIIVFKVGDHVFVACNHGESLTPAGQQGLLMLVQTAQIP